MKRDEKFNYEEMRCKWEIANNRHDARVLSSIGPRLYGHYTTAIISIRWPDNHMKHECSTTILNYFLPVAIPFSTLIYLLESIDYRLELNLEPVYFPSSEIPLTQLSFL